MSLEMTKGLVLAKGEKLDITKSAPGLKQVKVGMGWDVNAGNSGDFDLDAFAIALNTEGKTSLMEGVLYFNSNVDSRDANGNINWKDATRPYPFIMDGALEHSGDNLTGQGDGDDETITINIDKIPDGVDKFKIFANIFQAAERNQRFGQVQNAYIHIYDPATNTEFGRYDLSEDYSSATAVELGEFYRHGSEWKFVPNAIPSNLPLDKIAESFC